MKCKRPKHGLTPFRVVWPTACRFTQRPYGKYNSEDGICQISAAPPMDALGRIPVFMAPSGRGLSAKPTGGEKVRITSLPPSKPAVLTPQLRFAAQPSVSTGPPRRGRRGHGLYMGSQSAARRRAKAAARSSMPGSFTRLPRSLAVSSRQKWGGRKKDLFIFRAEMSWRASRSPPE